MPTLVDFAQMAAWRVLPDGRGAYVYEQFLGTAVLGVGALDDDGLEDVW